MSKKPTSKKASRRQPDITGIIVAGYKSIGNEQEIELRPLTILAGANSSGKSSMMQPILLLKQTLEASYDPGALLLNGPHVRFTHAEQLFSTVAKSGGDGVFRVGIRLADGEVVTTSFVKGDEHPLSICETAFVRDGEETILRMDGASDTPVVPPSLAQWLDDRAKGWREKARWYTLKDRCFLAAAMMMKISSVSTLHHRLDVPQGITTAIHEIIHLPGLRGNPERTYPVTAVADTFPGTFEKYVASIIAQWVSDNDTRRTRGLNKDLEKLGLTWKVTAKLISDAEVELAVGRLPKAVRGRARDMVNIADVGFGVSQVLPVVVALHATDRGQLVYVEQPELHLHPRSQSKLAEVLCEAAKRGVRLVVETHSALLLLAVQALVAEGRISPDMVKLHWFQRGSDGATTIQSADLDESGAFGDWPEDFAEVAMGAESRYLDAVETRHGKT